MVNMAALYFVLALKQSSRTTPAFAPLLGDSHGGPLSQCDDRSQKLCRPGFSPGPKFRNVNLG